MELQKIHRLPSPYNTRKIELTFHPTFEHCFFAFYVPFIQKIICENVRLLTPASFENLEILAECASSLSKYLFKVPL